MITNSTILRYVASVGILVFGFLVPILPRLYMIHMRSSNPERYEDVLRILHDSSRYFGTVFPFVLLSVIAWFSFRKAEVSRKTTIERLSGIIVSFLVIGYWGFAVSMPAVWGLAALLFSVGSIFILPLTYGYGGLIGYWLVKLIFFNQMQFSDESTNRESKTKIKKEVATLEEMFHKSQKDK